jgi:hypothetical protein
MPESWLCVEDVLSSLYGIHRCCLPLFAVWLAFGAMASAQTETATQQSSAFARLTEPGHVLLMRHAHAPGVGDPKGMALGDCSTQRNLDECGRVQARALGGRLHAAGVSDIRVYTSQWCRCSETARLLAVGTVEEMPALNSFFEQPEAARRAAGGVTHVSRQASARRTPGRVRHASSDGNGAHRLFSFFRGRAGAQATRGRRLRACRGVDRPRLSVRGRSLLLIE